MLYIPIIFFSKPFGLVYSWKYFPLAYALTYFCKASLQIRIAMQGLDSEMESVRVHRTGKFCKRRCNSRCPGCVSPGPAERTRSCVCLASGWLWMGCRWCGSGTVLGLQGWIKIQQCQAQLIPVCHCPQKGGTVSYTVCLLLISFITVLS